MISTIKMETDVPCHLIPVEQEMPGGRNWGEQSRLHDMVHLRNELLLYVRKRDPELFFSLDSDILLHKDSLRNLLETVQNYDAVGGKTYMTRVGTMCPSYAQIRDNRIRRSDFNGVTKVGAIMAMKLMTQQAYWVDYKYDSLGEDIGWSKNCKERGVTLGFDGRACSKHVMERADLFKTDKRCGF
jgi:hypothetical protein